MNMKNSKMNKRHKFIFEFSQRSDLRSSNKDVAIYMLLSIDYIWKNI